MKTLIQVLIAGTLLLGASAFAFPLAFTANLCTLDGKPLQSNVERFTEKLVWSKRFEAAGSRHRRHVERHANELIEAFDAAMEQSACSAQRKAEIATLKANLVRVSD